MYLECLKEDKIPWNMRWTNNLNKNGVSNKEYKGINQLMLNYISYVEKYSDCRWYTYVQIKNLGYKLKDSKGKGVPIEFWSVYDIKNKRTIGLDDYNKIVESNYIDKENYKLFCNVSYVFNADLIEGLPKEMNSNTINIKPSKFIEHVIKNTKVKYKEFGNRAYYNPIEDQIVLPKKDMFKDVYSYYATQLHELCHSTGNENRLNRKLINNNKEDYAREELIAEIASSFLMQKTNINPNAEHIDNHKAYIQSWIKILEDKPAELFTAINEANKVYDYVSHMAKVKEKEFIR